MQGSPEYFGLFLFFGWNEIALFGQIVKWQTISQHSRLFFQG